MAAVVTNLVFLDRFGKEEGTPIGDAADYTTLGEDEGACCASHPVKNDESETHEIEEKRRKGRYSLTSAVV